MSTAIFRYICSHLNEDERFTSPTLPDDPNPTIPKPLGSEDAFYYTTDFPPNKDACKTTIKLLRTYLKQQTIENRHKLYTYLSTIAITTICDPFADEFGLEDNNEDVLELARTLFYHANHREPFKFAILLCGIYGMDKLQEEEPEFWKDIVKAAHCEEFTFFFLFACHIGEFSPQKEIWQLLGCTRGWGKVYAINEANFRTPEEQQWLIQNGIDIDVDYPPLSIKLIRTTKLIDFLKNQDVSYESYKGTAAIVNNLLMMLNNFPGHVLEENFNISSIDVYSLMDSLLHIADKYCEGADDVLDIIGFSIGLRTIISNENWQQLTPNKCHLLLAHCEKIIFCKDWQDEINTKLIVDDEINYTLCDLAYELDMDIWDRLFKYWCHHPREIRLFPYLLAYEGDNRAMTVISGIERNINIYIDNIDDLLTPLRYLQSHPGRGLAIIHAALTSSFDWPRGVAVALLDVWGPEYITPALKDDLWKARKLSLHPVITARIDAILRGESFDVRTLTEQMIK